MKINLMKGALLLFLALGLALGTAQAASNSKAKKAAEVTPTPAPEASETVANPLYLGFGTGADLAGSNWDPNYQVAGGGLEFIGYRLDPSLSVQLEGQQWVFTGGGFSETDARVMVEAKYALTGPGWQPYVLAGPGLVFRGASPSGNSTTNGDALAGLGVQVDLGASSHLFVEARYNFTLTQDTTLGDVPLVAGLWCALP